VLTGQDAWEEYDQDLERLIQNLPTYKTPKARPGEIIHGKPSNVSSHKCSCNKCWDGWHAFNVRRGRNSKKKE